MNKQLLIGIVIVVLVGGGFFWYNASQTKTDRPQSPSSNGSSQNTQRINFENPKKAAHYESNAPAHGSVLGAPPINVVIDFNFDLAKPSTISITKEGTEYGQGDTVIDTSKLVLRRSFDPTAPDGTYTVNYKACWPDGSCHDGSFQFGVMRSEAEKAVDMRNKAMVNIDLASFAFNPIEIRISRGTKVVWTNSDDAIHYVNTDSHPAHTYYKDQNSQALNKGDTFSLTFDTPGAYPYHCSAHADSMTGTIIVE